MVTTRLMPSGRCRPVSCHVLRYCQHSSLSILLSTLVYRRQLSATSFVQIKSTYYSDIEKLLKRVTGATRIHIFDHTLRKGTIKDVK